MFTRVHYAVFFFLQEVKLKQSDRDNPGGPMVKISSSTAGGMGSVPSPGAKVSHDLGL